MLTSQSPASRTVATRYAAMEKEMSHSLIRFIENFMFGNHGEPFPLGRVCTDGRILDGLLSEDGVRAVYRSVDGNEERPFIFDLSVNRLLEICQAIAGAGPE